MLDKNFYTNKAEELEAMAKAMRKMAVLTEQKDLLEEGELDGGLDDHGYPCYMDKEERAAIEEKEYQEGLEAVVLSNTAEEPVSLDDIRKVLVKKKQEGHAAEIKALLSDFGISKVSALEESKFREFYANAKMLGDM